MSKLSSLEQQRPFTWIRKPVPPPAFHKAILEEIKQEEQLLEGQYMYMYPPQPIFLAATPVLTPHSHMVHIPQ